jgi:isoprenylcysteine carboxyl methyltransferase (ICMT) family protein YpbQ
MLSALANKPSITANAVAPPQSATNFTLSVMAMSAGLALVWVTAYVPALNQIVPYAPLIPCLGIILVIAVSEWVWPHLRSQSARALTEARLRPLDPRRVAIRIFGVIATLGLVAFAYWLLPEYGGTFYDPYWQFLKSIAPLAALVPFYMLWIDRRITEPQDDYYAFGALLVGGWATTDWLLIRRHLLGWTVKAFFLPLMTVYLADELRALHGAFLDGRIGTMPLYQLFYHLSYFIDLMFCVVGYSAAIRLFDAQIRSVEPTVAGWVVALICYQPFYSVIGRVYFQYDDNVYWDNWLQNWPVVRIAWAVAIIGLLSIYSLCTVSFGLRFSNLTHRGIITGGPYRFTKHPAYWAKNLSWWLISVPVVSEQGWSMALRNCCLLGLVNLVYYARARTEERHLSRDPTYVAYALWINEHGLLRGLSRLLPFARYRVPAANKMRH